MKTIKKLHQTNEYDFLFQVSHDKSVEYCCEHCGDKRGKNYFFTGETKKELKGAVLWCPLCSTTFPEYKPVARKFKKGDRVTYKNSQNEDRPAIVLGYTEYGTGVLCKCGIDSKGYSPFEHMFNINELSKKS